MLRRIQITLDKHFFTRGLFCERNLPGKATTAIVTDVGAQGGCGSAALVYAALDETTDRTGATCEESGVVTISDKDECEAAAKANSKTFELLAASSRPHGCHTTNAELDTWYFNAMVGTNDMDAADRLVCKSCGSSATTTVSDIVTTPPEAFGEALVDFDVHFVDSRLELTDPSIEFGCCFPGGWIVGVEYLHDQFVGGGSDDADSAAIGSYGSLHNRTKTYLAEYCFNSRWNGAIKVSDANESYTCLSSEDPECVPDLQPYLQTTFNPQAMACISNKCPAGTRTESIGRSYLLDCEPWLHADRSYTTRHAVAEQHCVACIVAKCKVCNENYRHCDECDAEHSLFINPVNGIHTCVERGACPSGYYSNSTQPTSMNLHVCVTHTACGDGQKEARVPTKVSDRICSRAVSSKEIGGAVGGILVVFLIVVLVLINRHQAKIGLLKSELKQLGKTLVGIRHVCVDFGPGQVKGNGAGKQQAVGSSGGAIVSTKGSTSVSEAEGSGLRQAARWYWREQKERMTSHNSSDVLQPGDWVSYSWSVCAELDDAYNSWHSKKGPATVTIDLANRISR